MGELGFYIDSAGRVISTETQLLPPQVAKEYELLADPNVRQKMGGEMATFVQAVHETKPDVLVFLDKSARPASWFFRYMWQELYPTEKRPRINYVNIGREKAVTDEDELQFMMGNTEVVRNKFANNTKLLASLKKAFTTKSSDPNNKSTYFDNKNIWIVDEQINTGFTLEAADALFEAAFGERVNTISTKNIFARETNLPWFKREYMMGVFDRKPGDVLTSPIHPIPEEVHLLRSELRLLAKESAQQHRPAFSA